MQKFSALIHQLSFTYSHLEKRKLLNNYFATTTDPERGYALAILSGELSFKFFKPSMVRDLLLERMDQVFFADSLDYVGDLAETVALLWPGKSQQTLPNLPEIVREFANADKNTTTTYLVFLLDHASALERFTILKIGLGNLRIGVSARFLKKTLADMGEKSIHDIEKIWHRMQPPYTDFFAWISGQADQIELKNTVHFHPVMLSHPLSEKDFNNIALDDFFIEWKYDGIRVELVSDGSINKLYTRSGDEITNAFPEFKDFILPPLVLDGELVIMTEQGMQGFNDLQLRLNRKNPAKKMLEDLPAHIILYDLIALNDKDYRSSSTFIRRQKLVEWYEAANKSLFSISPLVSVNDKNALIALREKLLREPKIAIEGFMLKNKESPYIAGRPKGHWYKWKKDPFLLDAVLMYAARGSGKRSSYYSDYTFGLWHEDSLLPIGKAYFGFTDQELYELDKWIRQHTINTFGPVREVAKELVFEIAFENVQRSNRHKSGFALRFPRIHRIRWEKPAHEADQLQTLIDIFDTLPKLSK